jgi:hypothetical protein
MMLKWWKFWSFEIVKGSSIEDVDGLNVVFTFKILKINLKINKKW